MYMVMTIMFGGYLGFFCGSLFARIYAEHKRRNFFLVRFYLIFTLALLIAMPMILPDKIKNTGLFFPGIAGFVAGLGYAVEEIRSLYSAVMKKYAVSVFGFATFVGLTAVAAGFIVAGLVPSGIRLWGVILEMAWALSGTQPIMHSTFFQLWFAAPFKLDLIFASYMGVLMGLAVWIFLLTVGFLAQKIETIDLKRGK